MWVHGKIFNVHVLVKIVCVLSFFLGIDKNYLHTPLHNMHTHQC